MNKKFFATAIVALSAAIATPMFAQNANVAKDKKVCNEQKCDAKKAPQARNPFEGLNLTAEQQAKLDALKNERVQQKKAAKEEKKADKVARMQKSKEARAKYLAEIKAILTPEQYVSFLENNFLSKNGMRNDKMRKGDQAKKGQRDGMKGQNKEKRGERGQRPDRNQK